MEHREGKEAPNGRKEGRQEGMAGAGSKQKVKLPVQEEAPGGGLPPLLRW